MPSASLAGSERLQQSAPYSTLQTYLSGKQKLGETLDAFCEPAENQYMSHGNPQEVEETLSECWQAIISQAAQTSFKDEKQQRLVQFVAELQRRPTLEKDGQVCQVQNMTVWQDLPTFGWALRDAWNFAADDRSDQDAQDQWINVNAFVASLLGTTYRHGGDSLGLSLFCIWSVRQALEESPDASNTAVAAAASWFVFASPTIRKLCEQQKSFDGKMAKAGSGFADAGWTGFSQERWQAWADKLAATKTLDSTAGELVTQARTAIDEVEQS